LGGYSSIKSKRLRERQVATNDHKTRETPAGEVKKAGREKRRSKDLKEESDPPKTYEFRTEVPGKRKKACTEGKKENGLPYSREREEKLKKTKEM